MSFAARLEWSAIWHPVCTLDGGGDAPRGWHVDATFPVGGLAFKGVGRPFGMHLALRLRGKGQARLGSPHRSCSAGRWVIVAGGFRSQGSSRGPERCPGMKGPTGGRVILVARADQASCGCKARGPPNYGRLSAPGLSLALGQGSGLAAEQARVGEGASSGSCLDTVAEAVPKGWSAPAVEHCHRVGGKRRTSSEHHGGSHGEATVVAAGGSTGVPRVRREGSAFEVRASTRSCLKFKGIPNRPEERPCRRVGHRPGARRRVWSRSPCVHGLDNAGQRTGSLEAWDITKPGRGISRGGHPNMMCGGE